MVADTHIFTKIAAGIDPYNYNVYFHLIVADYFEQRLTPFLVDQQLFLGVASLGQKDQWVVIMQKLKKEEIYLY